MHRSTPCRQRMRGDDGIVLIMSYLTIAVLLILQSAYFSRLATNHQLTQRYNDRISALHMAEAGVDELVSHLRASGLYPGTPETTLGNGTYRSTIMPTGNVDAASDILPWAEYRAEAVGAYPAAVPRTERTITSMIDLQPWPFSFGLFAHGTILVNGNLAVGSYDSRAVPMPPPFDTWGTVGTNDDTDIWALHVNGNFTAMVVPTFTYCGAGCNPMFDIVVMGATNVAKASLAEPKQLPAPKMCDSALNVPLMIPMGGTVVLPAGVTCLSSLTMAQDSTLTTTDSGAVVLLDGPLMFTGPNATIKGKDDKPPWLIMYAKMPAGGVPFDIDFNQVTIRAALYIHGNAGLLKFIQGTIMGSVITNGRAQINTPGLAIVYYDYALSRHPLGTSQKPDEYMRKLEAWIEKR